MHILIIDDEPAFARTLCRTVQSHGYRCLMATTATEAMTAASGDLAAIVLDLDVDLPGVDLLRQLRTVTAAPCVIHSGQANPSPALMAEAINLGGLCGWLTKPASEDMIMAALRRGIDGSIPEGGMLCDEDESLDVLLRSARLRLATARARLTEGLSGAERR